MGHGQAGQGWLAAFVRLLRTKACKGKWLICLSNFVWLDIAVKSAAGSMSGGSRGLLAAPHLDQELRLPRRFRLPPTRPHSSRDAQNILPRGSSTRHGRRPPRILQRPPPENSAQAAFTSSRVMDHSWRGLAPIAQLYPNNSMTRLVPFVAGIIR